MLVLAIVVRREILPSHLGRPRALFQKSALIDWEHRSVESVQHTYHVGHIRILDSRVVHPKLAQVLGVQRHCAHDGTGGWFDDISQAYQLSSEGCDGASVGGPFRVPKMVEGDLASVVCKASRDITTATHGLVASSSVDFEPLSLSGHIIFSDVCLGSLLA